MKYKSLILSLFLLLAFNVYGQEFPKYKDIVHQFFTKYDLKENQLPSFIRFSKQIEGYFIEEYNGQLEKFEQKQLFWSAQKMDYLEIRYPKGNKEENNEIKEFLKAWNADKFDLNPYYGYVNWEKDVIAFFSTKEILSNDELYAFARAFSNSASNLINNNSGFADSSLMFKLDEYKNNQLTKEQLKEYRKYRHKAIEKYGELCKQNSNYKTIVGSVFDKYYNEHLISFLDLRIYQNEIEANKELGDSLYSDFYINMAKNYLNSCDSNAVLFTNGDNDTYPLLYIQAKYRYRQDVLVVNLSLLNNNNYINHLRRASILTSDSISMTLSPKTYSGTKLPFVFFKNSTNTNEFTDLSKAIELVENQDTVRNYKKHSDYKYFVSNKLKIVSGSINIPFSINKRYIIKGELITLDIIQSNINNRPFYFLYNKSFGLQNNFELHGFVYKIVNSTDVIDEYQLFGGINQNFTFHKLINEFNFSKDFESNNHSQNIVFNTYKRSFCHLAKKYSDLSEKDSCRIVIDKYIKTFPNSIYKMDYLLFSMIKSAYKVNLIEEGNKIATTIVNNISKKIDKGNLTDRDIWLIRYTARELKKILANKNNELMKKIDQLIQKI